MTVRVITAPAYEPITVAELKAHLRITDSIPTDDALLALIIKSVRVYAEQSLLHRALVEQTLELTLPCFEWEIELPFPQLRSVVSVKYTDTDGVTQTVDPADYQVDSYREPALLKPAYQETWPSDVRTSDYNAVQIRYIAGYPSGSPNDQVSATENIPESIKHWMKIRAATLYEHPEGILTGTVQSQLPHSYVDGLVDAYRVGMF